MLAILLIGGVVCTALSMSDRWSPVQDRLLLGSTPKTIQWSNIVGSALASLVITAVIILFANVYGFGQPRPNTQSAARAAGFGDGSRSQRLLAARRSLDALLRRRRDGHRHQHAGHQPLAFALACTCPSN